MTYTLKGYDNWLLPPDPPTHGDCDRCGGRYDYDDMNAIDNQWLCDDCLEEYETEQEKELEEE